MDTIHLWVSAVSSFGFREPTPLYHPKLESITLFLGVAYQTTLVLQKLVFPSPEPSFPYLRTSMPSG